MGSERVWSRSLGDWTGVGRESSGATVSCKGGWTSWRWAARSDLTRLMAFSGRTLSRSSGRTRTKRFQARVWRSTGELAMAVK